MKEQIKNILEKVILDEDYITCDDLIDEGYIDSFDLVNIVSLLNKEFSIKIDIKDILPDNFKSVDTIIDLVNTYKAK